MTEPLRLRRVETGIPPDFADLQRTAEAEGRRCVVGALIRDDQGRVFVHRRGWDRSFLPGCWDIVGGHVETGEGLVEALEREVGEETGWTVGSQPVLAYVADWEAPGAPPTGRREFDFFVDVHGDKERPRLEYPKHVDSRWVGGDDLELLSENRGADAGLVRQLVELALRSAQGDARFPHATIFLNTALAEVVEQLRMRWDPAMASQIAAHVTVSYPQEVGDVAVLLDRVAAAAATSAPFRLRLGEVAVFGCGADGVFVAVDDIDGGWSRLRQLVVDADGVEVAPHVTLVHPRTTNRGPAAWRAIGGTRLGGQMVMGEVAVTVFDGRRWLTRKTFRVRGRC